MNGPAWLTSVARATLTHASAGTILASGFGILYGSLSAMIHADASRVVSLGGYFALCGLAAGLMVGLTEGFLNPLDPHVWPASPARRFRDGLDLVGAGPAAARPGRVRPAVRLRRRLREGVRGGRP